tara:strand:+ start:437 stop:580 length:144 start_codon:yes stop_codon:yes gene_type:complete
MQKKNNNENRELNINYIMETGSISTWIRTPCLLLSKIEKPIFWYRNL